jgi:hypothetical protein
MPERKPQWREAGNLATINVEAIINYDSYVELDENNKYILVANKACEQDISRRED